MTKNTTVMCGNSKVALPWRVEESRSLDDDVVVVLDPDGEGASNPDVAPPPDPTRNVVRLDSDGDLVWIVDPLPGDDATDYRHEGLWTPNDRVITSVTGGEVNRAEIDPATGSVLDTWARTEFRIGDRLLSFGDEVVVSVVWYDGIYVIKTALYERTVEGESSFHFYGFDADGTRLWRQGTISWTTLKTEDGIYLFAEPKMGVQKIRRLDVDTGEFETVDDGPSARDFYP